MLTYATHLLAPSWGIAHVRHLCPPQKGYLDPAIANTP
jgi:hypothetical protein